MATIAVRGAIAADYAAIDDILRTAFAPHPYSDHREHRQVMDLRRAGVLALELVAVHRGAIAGYGAFSRVHLAGAPGPWYGLAPLGVAPPHQRRGMGTQLVKTGLAQLRSLGAMGCIVLGDPRYYHRFGFRPWAGLTYGGAPPKTVMAVAFGAVAPQGSVAFHPAFF
jgi:putative acetyltransferase